MPAIQELIRLQSADAELDSLRARREGLLKLIGDDSSLIPIRVELQELTTSLVQVRARQRELDALISGFDPQIQSVEQKLYGGTVTSARELTDLQAEVAMFRRQQGEQEDALLALLEELEPIEIDFHRTTEVMATSQTNWEEAQTSLNSELIQLESEMEQITEEREFSARLVPDSELALYERLRPKHGGVAVASMRNDTCAVCHVSLPSKTAGSVRSSSSPIQCPSCSRILLNT